MRPSATIDGKPQPQQGDLPADSPQADPAQSPAGTSLRSLIYEAGVYGTGMLLARGLGIFLTPILARSLSAAEFGVLDLTQTGVLLGSMLVSLQLESSILRYYPADNEQRGRLLSTALALNLGGGLLLLVSAAGAAPFIRPWVSPLTLALAAASVLTGLLYTHGLTVLRAEREATSAAGVIALNTVLNLGGVVVVVGVADRGVAGVFGARVVADAACALGMLWWRRRYYRVAWVARTDAVRLVRFGAPLTPEGFLTFASAHLGKGILLANGTMAELGMLAVANRIGTTIKLGLASLRQAWAPYAFSIASHGDANATYARALSGYVGVAGPMCLAFVLFAPELVLLFAGRDYLPAQRVMGPLGAAAVIAGLPYIFNIALLLEEKTSHYTASVVIAFLVTLAASLVLIPWLGILGASLSGLLASIASAGSVLYFAQRARRIPYNFKLLYGFVGGATALGLAGSAGWLELPLLVRVSVVGLVGLATARTLVRARR